MKKIYLSIAAALLCLTAQAEGYQVNTLSAKQLGMAHTSVALKLDSESVWFNPAAAAHQESKFDISAGVTGIAATATLTEDDGTYSKSDNDLSTPLYLYMNYKLTDDLSVGLSFNTPYGSSMNWGETWSGASLVQDISLTAYCVQPTVSYKFLDDKLSVGAGLMLAWGNFEQSLANTTYSMTLGGDAGLAVGYNVGVMYDINDKWSLGVSYRSEMKMAVDEGDCDVDHTLAGEAEGSVSAELPMPWTLSAGASFYPTDRWTVTGEIQWVGWSAYDELSLTMSGFSAPFTDFNTTTPKPKNYSNTIMARLGTEFLATEWLTARAGIYFDQSPVDSDYLNPETPSMSKIGYTCGLSLMPTKCRRLSVDLSYAYISPAQGDREGSYPTETDPFGGVYKSTAHTFAVGLGFKM